MTATADGDLSEGRASLDSGILQEDEDSLSPNQKTEVSPVSQAWFTTKEDKDTLANKGHKWKQGMWSKEERLISWMSNTLIDKCEGNGVRRERKRPAEVGARWRARPPISGHGRRLLGRVADQVRTLPEKLSVGQNG
ncbi:cyclin-D-binding Myb-like transcription factor 1 isoform X1 [Lates japonicus]|uniref:Cyclin-D-binding Myb-like transcription factor 1 isoform X1 n=1 Tax=Lates japonicus TaxID=270547 RepID=A0AAD3M783_LATJO|nr:cyclin-D-binding Myb-like transcription factor 1 isoform X1 [Lates japonicus]